MRALRADRRVDSLCACLLKAEQCDVVPLRKLKQQLSRRLSAMPGIEPGWKRRAHEDTAPLRWTRGGGAFSGIHTWLVSTDVSVIIASHNTRAHLEQALSTLGQASEVIVVDAASTDGSQALVRERFPAVRLLELDGNPGYGGALNAGLAVASGALLVLMNADAWPLPGAIDRLHRAANAEPRAGILGPRLLRLDGTLQPSVRGFPTLWRLATEYLFLRWIAPRSRALNAFYGAGFDHRSRREAEFVVGAVLLVRRQLLNEIGGFDESFFMFNEEVDLCYRARAAGWGVLFCPEAEFVHVGGASTSQVWPSMYREQLRSHLRFLAKHRGLQDAERARRFLGAAMGFRAAVFGLTRRPERRSLSKDAARWLRSGRIETLLDPARAGAGSVP
jgi:N-acetylglucosaminyl-diphospho-decaprenol L-rhamnosyltransferase